MHAPAFIKAIWYQFDDFPMETLTKIWYFHKPIEKKQRDVSLMKEHREQFGSSGNCFDLAIWLLDECKKNGIRAYAIGHDLFSLNGHIAVVMEDKYQYLCDLGDQWIEPVLISPESDDFSNQWLTGFFPGAQVKIHRLQSLLLVSYLRPNGKITNQTYDLTPIDTDTLWQAAEWSQNHIKPRALVECRIPYQQEIAHWEYNNGTAFLSTSIGKLNEESALSISEATNRIVHYANMDESFVYNALRSYERLSPTLWKP
ncbi:MAG: hypothetical protein H0Z31_14065 [Bacillus sp. (in: Bacteria)]|nr:hypothetical protein [Bacillus sp. (in: firmicutes)]